MLYSKYFKAVINTGGIVNFNPEQITRIMNIVAIENQIKGVSDIRDKYTGIKEDNRYQIESYRLNQVLNRLTSERLPKELIEEMYQLSQD
jgi:hypothetical protein